MNIAFKVVVLLAVLIAALLLLDLASFTDIPHRTK
jgi:hypothetical protein